MGDRIPGSPGPAIRTHGEMVAIRGGLHLNGHNAWLGAGDFSGGCISGMVALVFSWGFCKLMIDAKCDQSISLLLLEPLIEWFTDWLMTDWLIHRTDFSIDWLIDWLIQILTPVMMGSHLRWPSDWTRMPWNTTTWITSWTQERRHLILKALPCTLYTES